MELLDEGNTVPFIARYRKEVTGTLDENQIRDVQERIAYLRNLEERKTEVVRLIAEQDKLTEELHHQILAADEASGSRRLISAISTEEKDKGYCGEGEGA